MKSIHELIQEYLNTPLLDKIQHSKELPVNINNWFLYEQKLNKKRIKLLLSYE